MLLESIFAKLFSFIKPNAQNVLKCISAWQLSTFNLVGSAHVVVEQISLTAFLLAVTIFILVEVNV